MIGYVYGVAAGTLAVLLEAWFKASPSYAERLWAFGPLAILLNWLIYGLVNASPSLPAALIVFSTSTLLLRVGVSLWLGHVIGHGTWAACGLLLLAAGLRAWRP